MNKKTLHLVIASVLLISVVAKAQTPITSDDDGKKVKVVNLKKNAVPVTVENAPTVNVNGTVPVSIGGTVTITSKDAIPVTVKDTVKVTVMNPVVTKTTYSDYKIITDANLTNFQKTIKNELSSGWQPLGGVGYIVTFTSDAQFPGPGLIPGVWYQALAK